ncbi:hypothetical protein IV460_15230 [Enterococcus casseliflavus]|uniref:hypothetical protein n=1 Tax=Enterococcus casseliflavus TaxID=37734 RepID=UPI001E34514D|nr:hypothetical protein [Enterococcus casseliflavus]MCD5192390.1 hypothetical protein [Enterococcus casseliflavus]
MTPTQESLRKLSDKELIAQLKIVRSVQRRFDFREKWIREEMERRSKDEQTRID